MADTGDKVYKLVLFIGTADEIREKFKLHDQALFGKERQGRPVRGFKLETVGTYVKKYVAKNVCTGEKIIGTKEELAERLNSNVRMVEASLYDGKKIKHQWLVKVYKPRRRKCKEITKSTKFNSTCWKMDKKE